ncbi:MAG: hypothetical protein P8X64_09955 [Anaerolineales bacterium]
MASQAQPHDERLAVIDRLVILARWCLPISAVTATVGLLFLIVFFAGFSAFGPLNDLAVIAQYVLMLPLLLLTWRCLNAPSQAAGALVTALGLAGMLAVIALQSLLVLGILPFRRQIVLVVPAFLLVTAWFVIVERLGSRDGSVPEGTTLAVLAGLVVGYPVWALDFYRRLASVPEVNQTEYKEAAS